jgi:hypothetical protein
VAVGLERAHAQFLSQRQGLIVVACSLFDLLGFATYGDVTEEPAGMRPVATSGMCTGEVEEAFGQRARLVHAADEE